MYLKKWEINIMNELDKYGKPISDCAQETLNETGGLPEKYRPRLSVLRASTGNEKVSNMVIDIGLDGIYIGSILGLFAGSCVAPNLPLVIFHVDPEWEAVHNGKIWGRKLELYGGSIIIKDIIEMVELYDQHKTQIERMKQMIQIPIH
jgi:hypothetical protein